MQRVKRAVLWAFFWVFIAPGLIMAALQLMAPDERREAEPPAVASVVDEPDYSDRVSSLLGVLRSMQAADYTQSMDMIGLALGAFRAGAEAIDDGRDLDLDDAVAAEREALRRELGRRQAAILPALRDALGPILRKQLWIENGSARTIGAGFRTVEFVAAAFASNRNIQSIQEEMHGLLMEMRFTTARYRWFEQQQDYTYYTMKPPADGDVVIWTGTGRWRPVE